MITIELITTDYVYGAADEITLRTSLDDWKENYIKAELPKPTDPLDNRNWEFKLKDKRYDDGFEFKFVLNRRFWSSGNNLRITKKEVENDKKKYTYYLNNFGFELPNQEVFRIDYVHVNEEYRTLKAEIQRRSQAQQNIVYLSLFSMGGLVAAGGQVLDVDDTNKVSIFLNLLLMIAPWIFLNLGILWCDHDKSIHNIGIYIRDVLENRCFPSTTPNLNFPSTIDKNSNPYAYLEELNKKKNLINCLNHYRKFKSISLGWEKTHFLQNLKSLDKNKFILPNIFPAFYFGFPSVLLISVDIFISFCSTSYCIDFLRFNLGTRIVAYIFVIFTRLINYYLFYVFISYWWESKQNRTRLFGDKD